VIPNVLGVWELHQIFKRLLREQVSIRDLSFILETISDHAATVHDMEKLIAILRVALGEAICIPYLDGNRALHAIVIHPSLEQRLQRIFLDPGNSIPEVSSPIEAAFLESLETQIVRMYTLGQEPVLVCDPHLRLSLHHFLAHRFPLLPVIGRDEIPSNVAIQPVETISLP